MARKKPAQNPAPVAKAETPATETMPDDESTRSPSRRPPENLGGPPQDEGERQHRDSATETQRAQKLSASTAIAQERVAITAARDPYRRAGLALGKNPLVIAVDDLDDDQREALDADPNVFIRAHEDSKSSNSEAVGRKTTSSNSGRKHRDRTTE